MISESSKTESPTEQNDIFGKTGNGTLDFGVARSADWQNSNGRLLNVSIWTGDFDSIYASALQSIGLEPVDTSADYNWEKFDKNLQSFASAFPQFPLLTAYQDMYKDYVLDSVELSELLNECMILQKNTLSHAADLALRKLIYGCVEALKDDGCLIMICD